MGKEGRLGGLGRLCGTGSCLTPFYLREQVRRGMLFFHTAGADSRLTRLRPVTTDTTAQGRAEVHTPKNCDCDKRSSATLLMTRTHNSITGSSLAHTPPRLLPLNFLIGPPPLCLWPRASKHSTPKGVSCQLQENSRTVTGQSSSSEPDL